MEDAFGVLIGGAAFLGVLWLIGEAFQAHGLRQFRRNDQERYEILERQYDRTREELAQARQDVLSLYGAAQSHGLMLPQSLVERCAELEEAQQWEARKRVRS